MLTGAGVVYSQTQNTTPDTSPGSTLKSTLPFPSLLDHFTKRRISSRGHNYTVNINKCGPDRIISEDESTSADRFLLPADLLPSLCGAATANLSEWRADDNSECKAPSRLHESRYRSRALWHILHTGISSLRTQA
ncbi:hypothetical protein Pcinc_018261 [Petrolisthes cinctipes]|uniref:Uncharacterized protein n=1 Tax=Petrolisthes cinctipes TaxID=88211 RepID=A0AAE1FSH6_PETCI|nr:hypothetical protein Pcinc_018261 [Petrolisthes cinctipes]